MFSLAVSHPVPLRKFRHLEAKVRYRDDAERVIHHLREYGDHGAWRAAQELHQCL